MRLTILFESPYWIGLLEDERDGYLFAARYIFGAEPSNERVYLFVQTEFAALASGMTAGVPVVTRPRTHTNPKRMQREIRRELGRNSVPSKAHEAIRLQIEQGKQERRRKRRDERQAERERKRDIAVEKAKARRRGH